MMRGERDDGKNVVGYKISEYEASVIESGWMNNDTVVMRIRVCGTCYPTFWTRQAWPNCKPKLSHRKGDKNGGAYYPSTPASNALRLSSKEDIPVKARIRAARASRSSSVGVTRRVASIALICAVAPTPRVKKMRRLSDVYYKPSTLLFLGLFKLLQSASSLKRPTLHPRPVYLLVKHTRNNFAPSFHF